MSVTTKNIFSRFAMALTICTGLIALFWAVIPHVVNLEGVVHADAPNSSSNSGYGGNGTNNSGSGNGTNNSGSAGCDSGNQQSNGDPGCSQGTT